MLQESSRQMQKFYYRAMSLYAPIIDMKVDQIMKVLPNNSIYSREYITSSVGFALLKSINPSCPLIEGDQINVPSSFDKNLKSILLEEGINFDKLKLSYNQRGNGGVSSLMLADYMDLHFYNGSRRNFEVYDVLDSEPTSLEVLIREYKVDALIHFLTDLNETQRLMLALEFFEGLTMKEIVKLVNGTEEELLATKQEALSTLRRNLANY